MPQQNEKVNMENPQVRGDLEDRDEKGRFIKGREKTGGRIKGSISIKTEIIKRLEDNPEELKEVVEYFIKNNRELMWQMIEGRPPQNLDLTSGGKSFIKPTQEEIDAANRAIEEL